MRLQNSGASRRVNAEVCVLPRRHSGMRHLAQARNPYSLSWLWIPGSRFARPGMTNRIQFSNSTISRHNVSFSPHDLREFCHQRHAPENRGRREDRVRAAPAVSRAKVSNKNAHEHTGSADAVRPSLRNGFTAYFVLSLATGFLSPSSLRSLLRKNLTPASGRRNHTSSPYAQATLVSRSLRVHRISPRVS